MKLTNKVKNNLIFEIDVFNRDKILSHSINTHPDFLIIGAAKAGTTSLFHYLCKHQAIIPSKEKELAYFLHRRSRGLSWYLSNFPLKVEMKNKLTFEATPGYLFFSKVPKRVYNIFPNIKCIALLRNPVERAYSHWAFYQNGSQHIEDNPHLIDHRSFEDAVEQEINSKKTPWIHQYLARGKYAEQLKRWYKYFPKGNILILDSSALKLRPNETLDKVASFLQISKFEQDFNLSGIREEGIKSTVDTTQSNLLNTFNATNYKERINPNTKNKLEHYFAPFNKELELLVGQNFGW